MVHRNNRTQALPRGFVAGLTPEGQLAASVVIPLYVGLGVAVVPKLALIVVSPVTRAYFLANPTATKAKFTHQDVSLRCVRLIGEWLKDLRLTAHTLGMHAFVKNLEQQCISALIGAVPNILHIEVVLKNARGQDDVVLVKLADHVASLYQGEKLNQAEEELYSKSLKDMKFERLWAAVSHK
ncbi:hypothetical protein GQ44DRAFT_753526 [Phaeosphaeriaceae sp. PMI808]|nr:hypothetical protein GQ44DRAFT_753526 [Phaeosphaeriaceae sp. PMI808]